MQYNNEHVTPEQRTLDFLKRAMKDTEHWKPSQAIAKCLGITYQRLLLTHQKEDLANRVWVTVLILVYCSTQLTDLHELWYEMTDGASVWLNQQAHFVDNREDLVLSACTLLNAQDVANSLLTTLFAETVTDNTTTHAEYLGDWKICYLDEPPYTMYYWNEKTNRSTWENPIEAENLARERLEKRKQKNELLDKYLPHRLTINRDRWVPPPPVICSQCERSDKSSISEATILCLACDSRYFCDDCCDSIHCTRIMRNHMEKSFRYRECIGSKGFPRSAQL